MSIIQKICSDAFTSMNGDIDPARLFGYGFVLLGGIEFLAMTLYMAIKTGHFDTFNFSTGLVGIGGALVAAAAGVFIKKSAEVPLSPTVIPAATIPASGPVPVVPAPVAADPLPQPVAQ